MDADVKTDLKEMAVIVWNGFKWLRIRISDGILLTR
jgi:hypothetical protein